MTTEQDSLFSEYEDRGWCIIRSRNKVPQWDFLRYADGTVAPPSPRIWYQVGDGVSVLCGPSHLAILDIDSEDALAYWTAIIGEELSRAPYVQTPKGAARPGLGHYYFDAGDDPPQIAHTGSFDVLTRHSVPVLPPTPGYIWIRPLVPGRALEPIPQAIRDAHRSHSGILAPAPDGSVRRRKARLEELLADPTPEHGADWRGGRQVVLTSVAGHLARRAFLLHQEDYPEFEARILGINRSHMQPPLPETDVQGMAARIWEAESNQDRFPFNDLGNAYRLAHRFQDRLRYTPGMGDMVYDGHTWLTGATDQAKGLVQEIVAEFAMRMLHLPADQAKEAKAWAKAAGNDGHLTGALRQARTLLLEPLDAWDADPAELNTPTGIFNLDIASLGPHREEARCTKITRGTVVPSWREAAPIWAAFLDDRFPDLDLQDFVLRVLGLGLYGVRLEKIMLWLHGGPDSGKSSLLEAVAWAMGSYAEIMPEQLLLVGAHHDSEMVKLMGARFVYGSELNRDNNLQDTRALDASRLKRLTGEGMLTARVLYQPKGIDFRMGALLAISSNSMPILNRDDPAAWIRLVVVPMERPIAHRDARPVSAIYAGEADGILTSLVAGWLDYRRRGLDIPDGVAIAKRTLFEEQNPLERWVRECVEPTGIGERGEENSILYEHYREFINTLGRAPLHPIAWGRAMTRSHPEWPASRQGRGPIRRPIRLIDGPGRIIGLLPE